MVGEETILLILICIQAEEEMDVKPAPDLNFIPNNLAESVSNPGKYDRYYQNKTILTSTLNQWNESLANITSKSCRFYCREEARA